MAKKRFGAQPATRPAMDMTGPLTPEEFDQLLNAGNGLFWEKQGEQLKLHRPELIKMGIDILWGMWADIEQMTNGGANATAVNAR
jgi:hypothetical protein